MRKPRYRATFAADLTSIAHTTASVRNVCWGCLVSALECGLWTVAGAKVCEPRNRSFAGCNALSGARLALEVPVEAR